jgi:hypothetical protein
MIDFQNGFLKSRFIFSDTLACSIVLLTEVIKNDTGIK